jgi:hypothetical protein
MAVWIMIAVREDVADKNVEVLVPGTWLVGSGVWHKRLDIEKISPRKALTPQLMVCY